MASQANDRNRTKFTLDEKDMPTQWYNIQADLPTPLPPVLHPGTEAADRSGGPGAAVSRWS